MFKKRFHSVYSDFKTSFFCKLFLFIGIFFIIIFVLLKLINFFLNEGSSGFLKDLFVFSKTTYPESILSFSIIFIAVGIILYFFQCQFSKLAKIADEIEKEESE